MELVATRVVAKTDRGRIGPEELLVVLRSRDEDGAAKHDYYLSNAPPETLPGVLARVAKAEHRVEECLQRGKSEAGLARLPGADVVGVAPPPGAVPDRGVVPGPGGAAGEKR